MILDYEDEKARNDSEHELFFGDETQLEAFCKIMRQHTIHFDFEQPKAHAVVLFSHQTTCHTLIFLAFALVPYPNFRNYVTQYR